MNTFDEIKALIEGVDDVIARIESRDSQCYVGQKVLVLVDLIQRVVQRL